MAYIVCQTPSCQQTYPLAQFDMDSKNVKCEKCGGVLIDKDGRANFSMNPTVIPVVDMNKLKQQQAKELDEKKKELKRLTIEIQELEHEVNQ